jgi:glucose-1-phosphate thymidylyltransferase
MKGVVLAGGTGSRLFPLTKITNKHLLPIYDKPMIYYPIQTLVDAGIKEILVVTGGRNSGDFLRLLANGKEFGLKHLDYTYQEGEGGIADALALAEHFADGSSICVVLGDNIIEGTIREAVDDFKNQKIGAKILLKEVVDAERFGVAEMHDGRIVGIEEKPKKPKSNYAVTGIYMYDETVFEKVRVLVPSGRGELEITDVNNAYIREGSMTYAHLKGWWPERGPEPNRKPVLESRRSPRSCRAYEFCGNLNSLLRKRNRQSNPRAGFERFDCRCSFGSICIMARRSRLLSRGDAHWARLGCGIPKGFHPGIRRAELSGNNQSFPRPSAPDGLLGAGAGHVSSGAGGLAQRLGNIWRSQHNLPGNTASVAVANPAGGWAWL